MEINQNKDESPAFPPKESKFMKSKYKINKENNGSLKDSPVVLLVSVSPSWATWFKVNLHAALLLTRRGEMPGVGQDASDVEDSNSVCFLLTLSVRSAKRNDGLDKWQNWVTPQVRWMKNTHTNRHTYMNNRTVS